MNKEEELKNRAVDAIEEAVACHSVGIVAGSGARAGLEIGTGVAISLEGRHFILTANHVVDDTPDDALMFFPRQAETLNRADRSEVMSLKRFPVDGLNLFQRFEIANRYIDKNTDLALLQVHGEDIEKRTTVQFFVLNHESVTPPAGTPVVSFGYPSEIAKQIEGGNFIAFTSVDWSEAVEHQDLPGCDQSIHFLKQYGHAEVEPAAHPRGFSGAGVWYRQGATPVGKIWTPRPQLAGVITHYYQGPKLLLAVRVEVVVEFMESILRKTP